MTIRNVMIPMFAVLAACNAKTLTVGGTPTGSDGSEGTTTVVGSSGGTSEVGVSGASSTGSGSCAPSDCASYTFACGTGTPTNAQCVLDTSDQFAEPFCTLTADCAAGVTPTCTWTNTPTCTSSGACAESSTEGGSGEVTVVVAPPGSSTSNVSTLSAYFDSATGAPGQAIGDCVYNADGNDLVHSGQEGVPASNPGTITVSTSSFSLSSTPACDGLYAATTSSSSITPGSVVSFAWTNPGDSEDGDDFSSTPAGVPAPHFATLAADDALASAAPVVTQATDLPVHWSVSGTPLSLESVVVLFTQGQATLACTFNAGAGSGIVPANALLKLATGSASYSVYSLQSEDDNGGDAGWDVVFSVEMATATPTGLANGTLTLQ